MDDTKINRQRSSSDYGCLVSLPLWVAILLHFFADRIWGQGQEPAILKWIVFGYGILFLIGMLWAIAYGKRDEKLIALAILAVIGLVVAFSLPRTDAEAIAEADTLVRDLSEKGAEIERRADSLPTIPAKPIRDDLLQNYVKVLGQIQEEIDWTHDLVNRVGELKPRLHGDKLKEVGAALKSFNEKSSRAKELRNVWSKQVRDLTKIPQPPV